MLDFSMNQFIEPERLGSWWWSKTLPSAVEIFTILGEKLTDTKVCKAVKWSNILRTGQICLI